MDLNGWVSIEELFLKSPKHLVLSIEDLKRIVAQNDKKRFAFSPDGQMIRANRGHSVPVNLELKSVVPVASKVGNRYGQAVLLAIDAEKMHSSGYIFYISENDIWLTDAVPPEYINASDI